MPLKRRLPFFVVGLALAISACSLAQPGFSLPFAGRAQPITAGKLIYFTATGADGPIRYRGGPAFGGMMGGSLTCASCHGADGRGGVHLMHMRMMDAPDIRWSTLSSGQHGDHDNEQDGAAAAYDAEAFMRAVRDGQAPDGETLSSDMPRWEISEQDLENLIAFLQTLPE